MAISLHQPFSLFQFLTLVALFSLVHPCFSFKTKQLNFSASESDWATAGATWYGSPDGAGSGGGACGYRDAVSQPPFSSMVTAGGPSLFNSGKGCGACYQVKCTDNIACSGNAITVVITDSCPDGPRASEPVHFDLSGTAFGAMAISGKAYQLRSAGVLKIQYARVACNYDGVDVTFRVDEGSNPNYFAVAIEYEDGDGDLAAVELQEAPAGSSNSGEWRSMQESWGVAWKLDSSSKLQAPFSLRLTALESGKSIVADKVILAGWQPGATYRSIVNFNA